MELWSLDHGVSLVRISVVAICVLTFERAGEIRRR